MSNTTTGAKLRPKTIILDDLARVVSALRDELGELQQSKAEPHSTLGKVGD